MATIYRMHKPDDIDALVKFWSENSGWDQIDRKEWERRFYHTPFGPSAVALAIDNKTDEIRGQIVFIPTEIQVDGKRIRSCRPYALMIHKDLRSKLRFLSLIQVISKMYGCATDSFKEKKIGLIHMMPDPGWVRAFKFLTNAQTGSFLLWSLSLPLLQNFEIPMDFEVKIISATDAQLDELWEKNSKLYGCSYLRTTKTLPWKTSHGDYKLLGIFKKNELLGFSASLVKEKDKQWLICDIMAAETEISLPVILKATCNAAQNYISSKDTQVKKIAILVTPLLENTVKELCFEKDNYKFPIVVQILDETISKTQVAPERWYASAND